MLDFMSTRAVVTNPFIDTENDEVLKLENRLHEVNQEIDDVRKTAAELMAENEAEELRKKIQQN